MLHTIFFYERHNGEWKLITKEEFHKDSEAVANPDAPGATARARFLSATQASHNSTTDNRIVWKAGNKRQGFFEITKNL